MPLLLKISALSLGLILSACVSLPTLAPTLAPADPTPSSPLLDNADPQLAAAVKAKPDDPEPWYQLANHYARKDQLIDAELSYREALQRGQHTRAQHNLGLVYIRLGIESLRKASTGLPEDHPARIETRRFLQVLAEAGY